MGQVESGFTLLELAVTLLLTGILLTMATLNLSEAQGRGARSSASELMRVLEQSALRAIRERGDVRVEFVPTSSTFSVNGRAQSLIGKSTISAVRFATIDKHNSTLILRADGSASPGKVTVRDSSGMECAVIQALRGARRIECSSKQ